MQTIYTEIIDGRAIAKKILQQLKIQVQGFVLAPKLAIILVGMDIASLIYIENKIKAADFVGVKVDVFKLPSNSSQSDLIFLINQLNRNPDICGIILQLPVPIELDMQYIIQHISPQKDVDGMHHLNIGMLNTTTDALIDYKGFVPCTALACIKALDSICQDITGKNIVIVNRSNLVGKPLSALLLQKNATVSICHSFTKNITDIMQNADIVICAIGKSRFFNKTYFKQNAIIIDVGISRKFENGKNVLCGDVDFASLIGHASYITPVPGGIGPITVACLLSNVVKAFKLSQQIQC